MESKTLADWRKEIDDIDDQILQLLTKRVTIVKKIGEFKLQNNIPFFDPERKRQMLETKITQAEKLELPSFWIKKLYEVIHDLGLSIEEKLQKK